MITLVLVSAAAFLVGGILSCLIWQITTGKKTSGAKEKADKVVESAQTREKEILLQAKDEALKLKTEAEKAMKEKSSYLEGFERELRRKESTLDNRFDRIENSKKEVETKHQELETIKSSLQKLRQKQEDSLEKIAKMSKDEAKEVLLKIVERGGKDEIVKKMREIDMYVKDNIDDKAREVLVSSMQRIAAETAAETTVSTVNLPSDDMKGRIIGREGRNIQAFERITGVDLVIDDTPEAVVLSSFDPIRRQVSKVTLESLVADGRIHPTRIEEAFEKAKRDVAADIKKSGEEAAAEIGVTGLPPEILRVLGRLKFRTSYGQNQLHHVIEVARIGALLSDEIGADTPLVKRACLLHDLGKAVDHEVPGSHAVISADIARKYKLPEDLIHAVEAHHEDVEVKTVEASIVQIADAISSARPGARRESLESYIKRLEELEKVANSFLGVEKSFAIQAGREVRVLVIPEEIDDLSAAKLAKEIAKKIEEEVQYPGQVKINVIREIRATEYAK